MHADTGQQALTLLLFAALGAVLALLYCMITPLRRAVGRLGAAVCDILFSLLSGTAIFLLSMYVPGRAQADVWDFFISAAAFCIFMLTSGEYILYFFRIFWDGAEFICINIKNFFEKSSNFTKFFFTNRE